MEKVATLIKLWKKCGECGEWFTSKDTIVSNYVSLNSWLHYPRNCIPHGSVLVIFVFDISHTLDLLMKFILPNKKKHANIIFVSFSLYFRIS